MNRGSRWSWQYKESPSRGSPIDDAWHGLSLRARRALNTVGIVQPSHAATKSRESLISVSS